MAQIHWIARAGVGAGRDQPLWRYIESWATTTPFNAIETAETILEIAPEHQREKQRMEVQVAAAG